MPALTAIVCCGWPKRTEGLIWRRPAPSVLGVLAGKKYQRLHIYKKTAAALSHPPVGITAAAAAAAQDDDADDDRRPGNVSGAKRKR